MKSYSPLMGRGGAGGGVREVIENGTSYPLNRVVTDCDKSTRLGAITDLNPRAELIPVLANSHHYLLSVRQTINYGCHRQHCHF